MSFEEIVPNERLRRARDLRGWTQADLAEALGTDFETVSRWERGITVPSSYYREKLCTTLGKTAEELGLRSERLDLLATSTRPYIFLASSFADAELEFVTRLKADLQTRAITILSSRAVKRHGGANINKALQEAVRAAQVVLVVASPAARSSRHVQEALQLAKIYQRPISVVWIAGESWQVCMPKDSDTPYTTIDGREGYGPSLFDEIVAMLERAQLAPYMPTPSFATYNEVLKSHTQPRNPYKGLQAFSRENAQDFFGRESLIDKLVASLEASLLVEKQGSPSARILAVVGPSGSGKSSVVMAGLLPRLQSGGLPGSEQWIYLGPIIPGIHPIESLALALAEKLPNRSLHTIRDDLEDESAEGLHLLAAVLAGWQGTKVMLVVDQFEELFTQTASEEERQHFLALLLKAVTEARGPVVIVLTLRADFFDRPMYYSELGQLLEDYHTLVFPMDINALRAVIEQPAALPDVQLIFEGDLVGDLLFEMQGQRGALPLLQFTLDQLYQRRSGHTLTLRAYHEIGGVKGALVKHAEATYAALPSEEHRRLVRALFLRLIDPGMTEQDTTRRRALLAEFSLTDPAQTRLLRETLDAFIAARLLTATEVRGSATLEVSHEAVIREWPRLAGWLREAREDIPLQQAISKDVAEWEEHGRPRERLYRGTQLRDAQGWARRNLPSEKEVVFLRAGAVQRLRFFSTAILIALLLLATTSATGWFLLHQSAPPDPTRVTTLQDGGPGSLRWAIENAPAGSTITFSPGLRGTIMLTGGDLQLVKDLTLRGPGAKVLAISSGTPGYTVHITLTASVSISGLAFKDNTITNEGTLSLSDSTVSGKMESSVSESGGIFNSGTLMLTNSVVTGNTALNGGGILNSNYLVLTNSIITGNTAPFGGGIYNVGTMTLTNSTVANNTAQSSGGRDGQGGGIYNVGTMTLTNSTVANNTAQSSGGGIESASLLTQLSFCTIYGNKAAQGGGINVDKSFDNNENQTIPSPIRVAYSLVAGNSSSTGPDISGPIIAGGYNLIQNLSGATVAEPTHKHSTDLSGMTIADVHIDSELRDNGGHTQTLALFVNSPARDRIPLSACSVDGISTDQHGVQRPDDDETACDIGAYESTD